MAEKKTKQRFELALQPREETGKAAMKRLRAEGFVPVVIYAGGEPALMYKMTWTDLRLALHSGERIFNFTENDEQRRAMVKDIQYHPVTDKVIHIDFQAVRLRDIIEIVVPVHLTGEAIGLNEGGLLQHLVHELTVRCKGENVPDSVDVDVTNLALGESIQVADIQTEDYEIVANEDLPIAAVTHPQVMELEAAVVDEDEDLEFEEGEEPDEESSEEESEDKE
jgi:large subunit ribosomal protein L25